MASDMIETVWGDLKKEIEGLQAQINKQLVKTERSEYTDGIPAYTFVALPTTGLADGSTYITLAWVSNGRKSGEGAGLGTGVLAIWQQSTATWKRVGDYVDVTI
jgi:hypothetical protein